MAVSSLTPTLTTTTNGRYSHSCMVQEDVNPCIAEFYAMKRISIIWCSESKVPQKHGIISDI